ncbi:MAG: transporter substrate-binding domain-containing protein, partial [Deltaproteobacteria bacterium]|nr:transporter substrate-binding domain-containing protein [Deltaproteobacteria bacterium]
MKKKTLSLIIILFIQAFTSAAAQADITVNVGVYQNKPLTFIEPNGSVRGFFIDVLENIAKKEGWNIHYTPDTWSQCLTNLKNGKIDLLGVIAYSKERSEYFDYTYQNFITEWGQIYITKGKQIESILDLKDKKIAVLQNDMHFITLKNATSQLGIKCRFIEAFEYQDVLGIVETGKCDAGLVSHFYGIQYEEDYEILKSSIIISPEKLYYAAGKDKNSDLLYALDRQVRELKNDEHSIYYQSINKWFGGRTKSVLPKWFKWIIACVVALLFLFLVISLLSRAQVKLKTKELTDEIEQRVLAEKALRKNEEKYRDLVENINEIIFTVDKKGLLTYVSPAVESILGYSPSEILGKQIGEIIYKEDLQFVMGRFQKVLSGAEIPSEYRLYKKSGEICWVYSSSKPIFDEKGVCGLQGMATDIDDRKRAEEEKKGLEKKLARSQKMEALGLLAGGVAHDLNNVLSGVINYPELLLMNLPAESPMKKSLLAIRNSGLKAAAIVQDLLNLTRRGVNVNEVLNLNDIISDHLRSPEHKKTISYHPGVDVETNLEPDLLNINGSPVHLKKAVMNLLSNAVEAQPGGGWVTISTENRYVDSPIKGYDNIDEGDFAVLRIEDNGTGIAVEDLENIFEPFYTKKEMGRSGTGLGMTVVWTTVQDHQGYINIESTVGKGTAFELYFPVTREEIAKEKASISLNDYMGRGETILVVDDIKEQREVASIILKTLDYFVTSVSSGEEALDYIKNNSVDLLVLDMIMSPGMDGLDTYKKILEIHPSQKA